MTTPPASGAAAGEAAAPDTQSSAVLISGASGLVGGHLARALAARGDSPHGFSRDPSRLGAPIERGFAWDPQRGPPPPESFAEADAIVHLAGETVQGRWTEAKKRRIRDSRVVGTRHLVAGLERAERRPKTLICASAVGYYGDRGERALTERDSPGDDFLAEVCQGWEREAQAAEALGLRVVRLRIGLVLAREGGALKEMLLPAKLGVGGPLGGGQQWWSWIHHQDLVRLILWALDEDVAGPLNATSPNPVRQREFADQLGAELGRPSFLPAPRFALELALGEFSVELLSSKRVLPAAAQAAGFRFDFPDLRAALRDLL